MLSITQTLNQSILIPSNIQKVLNRNICKSGAHCCNQTVSWQKKWKNFSKCHKHWVKPWSQSRPIIIV